MPSSSATRIMVLIPAAQQPIQSLTMESMAYLRLPAFSYPGWERSSWRPKSNGYCSQRQQHSKTSSVETVASNSSNNSSNDLEFLNSRSRQAVTAMSEFLAAHLPTNRGLPPLHQLSRDAESDLDPGFNIDKAGLTSDIQNGLAEVSRTLTRLPKTVDKYMLTLNQSYAQGEERIRTIKRTNETTEATAIVSYHLSYCFRYLLATH